MFRLKIDALTESAGVFLYQNRPYNGVCFKVAEDHSVYSSIVRDGVIAGRYFPNFFDGMSDFAQIDASDAIQEKDGSIDFILEHEGVAFTGVAYEFDDDICCREIAYKNGRWYGMVMRNGMRVNYACSRWMLATSLKHMNGMKNIG